MSKPKTIDECMIELTKLLSKEDLAEILKMSANEVGRMHHSLGQWIRNNWDLWKGGELKAHMESLGFIHPDDMSNSILMEFWNRLNNQPSQLQSDIEEYKKFWENNK